MSPLRLALLDLQRKRFPTILTIVAIAVSVVCAGVLLKLNVLSESRFSTLARGPDAVIGAKTGGLEMLLGSMNLEGPYPEFIPARLFETLVRGERIQFADGSVFEPTVIRLAVPLILFARYRDHRIAATDERFLQQPSGEKAPRLVAGRWCTGPGEVVIGKTFARDERAGPGDTLLATAWTSDPAKGEPVPLRIVGVLAAGGSAWERAGYTSLADARAVLQATGAAARSTWGSEVLQYILVYLQPGAFHAVAELINDRSVAEAISPPEETARLAELTGTGMRLGLGMTVLILLLAALVVAAVMATRFEAMRVQLAVLRALGFTRLEIGRWIVWEGMLLGVVATILGAVLESALFPTVRSLLGGTLPGEDVVAVQVLQSAPVWCAAVGGTIIAVLLPMVRSARQDVHGALKGV